MSERIDDAARAAATRDIRRETESRLWVALTYCIATLLVGLGIFLSGLIVHLIMKLFALGWSLI